MKTIKLQPSAFTDRICDDGQELTKLPYPFYVNEDGEVGRQDFWQGDPAHVIGFQRDLAKQSIDLWWDEVVQDPKQAVGTYLVTTSAEGVWSTHQIAIAEVSMVGEE